MGKKKVTFLINENLYDSFKKYCENEEVKLSDKFEILIANTLRKEGVNIKEYPTLTSMFTRITHGVNTFPEPEKPIYLEPRREQSSKFTTFDNVSVAGQAVARETSVKPFDQVVKEVVQTRVINPKRIISSKPVPTIDQLRSRLGR